MALKILGLILLMFSIVDGLWLYSDGDYEMWSIIKDVVLLVMGIGLMAWRQKTKIING